jgi:hypothetical protein
MKLESPGYTVEDLERFVDELVDHERGALADRLEAASKRLTELGARVPAQPGDPGTAAWNAHEILAHIAVLSKFYGVLTYQIGSGRLTELGLLENVHLRDVMGSELAKSPPAQLVEMALADQRRTLEYLRSAAPGDLRRECIADGRWRFTAEDMARRPLVAHLELHLDQLERALA